MISPVKTRLPLPQEGKRSPRREGRPRSLGGLVEPSDQVLRPRREPPRVERRHFGQRARATSHSGLI